MTYVEGHLQEALAREGETDVHVAVANGLVVMSGTVATDARRAAVVAMARSLAGELEVRDQVTVLHCTEPAADGDEHLA